MLTAILHGKEDLRIEERSPCPLKPGEVRVRIEAALTCGTDLKVYKRGYHARMLNPPCPFGHELAGVICEVHPETKGWKVGARVVAANSAPCGACFHCQVGQENLCDDLLFLNGAYAESIVIPARVTEKNLLPLRDQTAFPDAALTEPFACVVQGVRELQLKGNERVLIIGSGPIGLMFAALCAHLGCAVTVAGRGETRLALAAQFGAGTVEVPRGSELLEHLQPGDRHFDVVIEAVGRPETWQASVELVRKGGTINFFGGCPSGATITLDTGKIHYSNLKLLASFHHTPSTIREALNLIESGLISAQDFVSGEHSLEELPRLFRSMAAGNAAVKTLIRRPG